MKKAFLAVAALSLAIASLASAEVIQKDGVRVSFDGKIAPRKLPRAGSGPVSVSVGTRIEATKGRQLPQLCLCRRQAAELDADAELQGAGVGRPGGFSQILSKNRRCCICRR